MPFNLSNIRELDFHFDKLLFNGVLSRKDIYESCKISDSSPLSKLTYDKIEEVLLYLNIDLEELMNDSVCPETVKKQVQGESTFINPKWTRNEGTRLKTVSSALSVVRKPVQAHLLRKLQLKEEVFEDELKLVSIELLERVFNFLPMFSYTKKLDLVGQVNCQSFLKSGFIKDLDAFTSPVEAYTHFLEHQTAIIEKNMDYNLLKVTSNSILVEYTTKESLQDFSGKDHFGNIGFCQNIQGFLEELIMYKYKIPPRVKKLSCAHLGQRSCTYEIVFDSIMTH